MEIGAIGKSGANVRLLAEDLSNRELEIVIIQFHFMGEPTARWTDPPTLKLEVAKRMCVQVVYTFQFTCKDTIHNKFQRNFKNIIIMTDIF